MRAVLGILLALAGLLSLANQVSADLVTFTVDSSASRFTLYGETTIEGYYSPLFEQFDGSLTARLSGELEADLNLGTRNIFFQGGTLTPSTDHEVEPPFTGPTPGQLGGYSAINGIGDLLVVAVRDTVFDFGGTIGSSTQMFGGGPYLFSLNSELTSQAGTIDFGLTGPTFPELSFSSGLFVTLPFSSNNSSLRVLPGGQLELRIPFVSPPSVFNVLPGGLPAEVVVGLSGEIVARTQVVPEAGSLVLVGAVASMVIGVPVLRRRRG